MKSANLSFYKNDVIEDTAHLFSSLTNTLLIQDQKDFILHLLYDEAYPSILNIQIVNSTVTILEEVKGELNQIQTHIDIDETSSLSRIGLNIELNASIRWLRKVDNKGFYQNIQLDLSNNSIDNEENIHLLHEDSKSQVITALYAQNKNKKLYQTNFIHQSKITKSDCKIFGVCNDFAQMTIATDAYIMNGARDTKAIQEGRIINLTKDCKGIILPELHIDENEVEAAHSCSVGSVNEDHLYYLQTRGFSQEEGKNLLIKSYFTPIFKFIEDESLKEKLQLAIQKRIG